MAQKSTIKVIPKKKRGRPATGRDPLVALRLPQQTIDAVDEWAKRKGVSRSAAMRAMIERVIDKGPMR
jgi:hypothetical protein